MVVMGYVYGGGYVLRSGGYVGGYVVSRNEAVTEEMYTTTKKFLNELEIKYEYKQYKAMWG